MELKQIPLQQIKIVSNYRKTFEKAAMQELKNSIREDGVLEPVIVRQIGALTFELIAGERRYRACDSLNMVTFPRSSNKTYPIRIFSSCSLSRTSSAKTFNTWKRPGGFRGSATNAL